MQKSGCRLAARLRATFLLLVCGGAACGRAPAQNQRPKAREQECRVSARAPRPVRLPDGSRILVDASSMAVQGNSVLIPGSPTYVFNRPRNTTDATVIGIVRNGHGTISTVPSPISNDSVRDPQAIAAKGGGWHVLFATGKPGTKGNLFAYETADIWYAHYDGRRWTGTQRVARARSATVSPRFASSPIETDQGLAFAYIYDRSSELRSNAAGNQGLVMLVRRPSGWAADTLRTWEAPESVHLTVFDGRVRAFIAQSYFTGGRPHGPALFTADYNDGWGTPRLVDDPAPEYVPEVMKTAGGENARGVSWLKAAPGPEKRRLVWEAHDDEGTIQRSEVITQMDPGDIPAIVALADRTMVWLARDADSRERLRVYLAPDTRVRDAGTVAVPLMNFVTSAVPLKDGRVLIFTGGPDPTPGAEPPFASYLTEIAVGCTVDRR